LNGGIDVAGTIAATADGRFREGDEVIVTGFDLGVAQDGGFAEHVRVPGDWVVPMPKGLTPFEAMALGTAGFTAGLSIVRLEQNGLTPEAGPVIVTGATGGVGSVAVASLAARGYRVTALTGKDAEHEYLRALGASDVLARSAAQDSGRPLDKATWAGAVDPAGGSVLAWLARTMNYAGSIACSGLTAGVDVHTTVLPFILRGVNLLGIDSVACPMPLRLEVWRRLAGDLKPRGLARIATEIGLAQLPDAFQTLLKGEARGRFVVRVTR
jgi:putative YhdH/YhfP family quinone oxidoreductase